MGLFKKFEDKVNEEIDEITCDKCGKTLKNHKNNKDKHLCSECYSKIFDK
jgi:protein-arginine kinase activator protein McsA